MRVKKIMNMKQLAYKYCCSYTKFRTDFFNNEDLIDELYENNWERRKLFYPIHIEIIEKYFGTIEK